MTPFYLIWFEFDRTPVFIDLFRKDGHVDLQRSLVVVNATINQFLGLLETYIRKIDGRMKDTHGRCLRFGGKEMPALLTTLDLEEFIEFKDPALAAQIALYARLDINQKVMMKGDLAPFMENRLEQQNQNLDSARSSWGTHRHWMISADGSFTVPIPIGLITFKDSEAAFPFASGSCVDGNG